MKTDILVLPGTALPPLGGVSVALEMVERIFDHIPEISDGRYLAVNQTLFDRCGFYSHRVPDPAARKRPHGIGCKIGSRTVIFSQAYFTGAL